MTNVENLSDFQKEVETDTSEDAPQAPTGGPEDIGNGVADDLRNDRGVEASDELINEAITHAVEVMDINAKAKLEREVPLTKINKLKKAAASEFGMKPKAFSLRLEEKVAEIKKIKKRNALNEEERMDFDALTQFGEQVEMPI